MSVLTEAPGWLVIVCVIAGLVYAGALYFKDRFNRTYGHALAALLGFLRFVCVSVLALFLLKPIVKSINSKVEKPIVVIALDNSESLVVGKDSSFVSNELPKQLQLLVSNLENDFEVRTYHFGSEVEEGMDSLSFNDQLTDFSNLLDEVYNKMSGRNLGAVIIASDGLYNKGRNPVQDFKKLEAPVYTIALGDTTVHKDILISEVANNRLAFRGNKFPVEITVEGRKAAGENSVLTVSRNGSTLFSEAILFTGERFFKTVPITFDAKEIGLQKYTVLLSPVKNEITTANNRKDIFIDVLDGRQRVLVIAASPHPDIAAIRNGLAENEGYKVEAKIASEFNGNLSDYSLIVFHQLPATGGAGSNLVSDALAKNIPSLFVWGSATDFVSFNQLQLGYALNDYRNNTSDIRPSFNESFPLFNLEANSSSLVKILPPLTVPFGDMEYSAGISTLFTQQIGQIQTDKPLVSFNKSGDTKVGLIAGEGIWRWRLTDYQESEQHARFNDVMTRIVQYLASKEDKSLFRVHGENDFLENEHITFEAELYNASLQPLSNREVSMKVLDEDGKEFTFTFTPSGSFYRLDAGSLPPGNYTYSASASNGAQVLYETGEFSVSPLQLEIINTTADHRLMYQLATESNGEMVNTSQIASLADLIRAKKEIVPVAYESKVMTDLINYRWILVLLLFLLAAEWLLRKRAGTY